MVKRRKQEDIAGVLEFEGRTSEDPEVIAWLAEHKASLPLSELPLAEVEDDRLARVLGELGRAVEARAAREQDRGSEACS